ncbi:endonuclease/exonuclease/phosphatase family protein [Oscillospiraceae bacterium PP1C4]
MNDSDLIRIISFNLKRDFGISFNPSHKWGGRRALAAQFIKESGATIIGVQELLPNMRDDVSELLSAEYSILGFGRFRGLKPSDDEHSDIIIKNEDAKVNLIKTFWLSKSPERFSRAYYAMFPRICTVAEVYLKDPDRTIRVFNTHLDHICGIARVLGVKVILEYIDNFNKENPLPTILMGDFNCRPGSRPIRMLHDRTTGVHLTDVYSCFDASCLSNTLHHFRGKIKPGAHQIDYIYVSDEFEIVDSRIITEPINGVYPSDHYPLMATLRLKDNVDNP